MKLISYRKNIYSQNGEDGIIEEILKRLDIKIGSFVEFGALDGVTFSNTYNLLKNKNWQGFYIESDKKNYFHLEKLKEIYKERLTILNERVEIQGESSLDNLIKKHTNFSKEFDLLSIDIDSFDYQIFESLQEYKPTIIIIEIESTIHPPKERIHDGIKNFRTSFSSMVKLGQTKGYTAVCHTGNIIFVRNDKLNQIKLEEEYIKNPEQLFLFKGWFFENPSKVRSISWKEEIENELETIFNFYKSDKGTSGEGHRYATDYQQIVSKDIKNLLEIGIGTTSTFNGSCGSIRTWLEWLPEAIIYGFDMQDAPEDLKNNKRFKLFIGNQNNMSDIGNLKKSIPDCDIIIDDGSHINNHQIMTFFLLWDKVKPGGYYIIEDIHCGWYMEGKSSPNGWIPLTKNTLSKHPNFLKFIGKINEGMVFKK